MGGMFLIFVILGISSANTYKKLEKKAISDNELEADILKWVRDNLSVDAMKADDVSGESEEVS